MNLEYFLEQVSDRMTISGSLDDKKEIVATYVRGEKEIRFYNGQPSPIARLSIDRGDQISLSLIDYDTNYSSLVLGLVYEDLKRPLASQEHFRGTIEVDFQ